jgi:AcrR family transcriptional regulator
MEDRRITRTRNKLKNALIKQLAEKSFDDVTVTDICKTADVTRVTFYTHYSGKQDLLKEIITETSETIRANYRQLQAQNNPADDSMTACINALDALVMTKSQMPEIIENEALYKDPFFLRNAMELIREALVDFLEMRGDIGRMRYSAGTTAGIILGALAGVVEVGYRENQSKESMRHDAEELLRNLLSADVLFID